MLPHYGSPCWARTERRKKTDTLITQYARKLANLASSPCARGAGAFALRNGLLASGRALRCRAVRKGVDSAKPSGGSKTKTRGICLGLCFGSPCWARTSDTLINSQVLVPTELRRNMKGIHRFRVYPFMSAMTYLSGSSPTKYFRHCKA